MMYSKWAVNNRAVTARLLCVPVLHTNSTGISAGLSHVCLEKCLVPRKYGKICVLDVPRTGWWSDGTGWAAPYYVWSKQDWLKSFSFGGEGSLSLQAQDKTCSLADFSSTENKTGRGLKALQNFCEHPDPPKMEKSKKLLFYFYKPKEFIQQGNGQSSCLKEVGVSPFSQVTSARTRWNSLKLY